jgi:hypothetical protein
MFNAKTWTLTERKEKQNSSNGNDIYEISSRNKIFF